MANYDLVTVRSFNGVEDGSYSWIFLSYAVVIKKENRKAVCLRDENIEYEYVPAHTDADVVDAYKDLSIGDIRIFNASDRDFDNIFHKTKKKLLKYVEESPLYFNDDIKYGKNLLEQPKIKMIKK